MLSSIHPLGERARHNRWSLTVAAFVMAAVASGAAAGALLGALGGLVPVAADHRLGGLSALVMVAALLDFAGVTPPGPRRQVDERWIGSLRGWVYGAGFGAQLGFGGATYVVTWLVPATAVAATLAGSAASGATVGVAFAAMRAAPLVATRWIDRPSRLGVFHRRMARLGPPIQRVTPLAAAGVGLFVLLGAL